MAELIGHYNHQSSTTPAMIVSLLAPKPPGPNTEEAINMLSNGLACLRNRLADYSAIFPVGIQNTTLSQEKLPV